MVSLDAQRVLDYADGWVAPLEIETNLKMEHRKVLTIIRNMTDKGYLECMEAPNTKLVRRSAKPVDNYICDNIYSGDKKPSFFVGDEKIPAFSRVEAIKIATSMLDKADLGRHCDVYRSRGPKRRKAFRILIMLDPKTKDHRYVYFPASNPHRGRAVLIDYSLSALFFPTRVP